MSLEEQRMMRALIAQVGRLVDELAEARESAEEYADLCAELELMRAERDCARERLASSQNLRLVWEQIARDIGRHDKASIAAALSAACAPPE